MKEIKVFQTEDKKTFDDKGDAVRHELMLELRGFLQSGSAHERINSPTDAAAAILAKGRKRLARVTKAKA